jgi:sulfatase modifying factor 1
MMASTEPARRLARPASAAIALALTMLAARSPDAGEPRPGRTARHDHARSEMVDVTAGTFTMGFADEASAWTEALLTCERELGERVAEWYCRDKPLFKDAVPERQVFVPAFSIDRHEVTVASFRRCIAAARCDVAALTTGDQRYTESELPVVNVTWQDAADYCAFAAKRLPTEAEWERAARGTDGRRWPWGQEERLDDFNHGANEVAAVLMTRAMPNGAVMDFVPDDRDGAAYLARPGSEPWGQSPTGAEDMAGNAAEWVADFYASKGYADLPLVSPVRLSRDEHMTQRVVRGGSWLEPPFFGRTYARRNVLPSTRSPAIGFRCARSTGLAAVPRAVDRRRVTPPSFQRGQ